MLQLPWIGALCVASSLLLHWFVMNTLKDRVLEIWAYGVAVMIVAALILAGLNRAQTSNVTIKRIQQSLPQFKKFGFACLLLAALLALTATRIAQRLDDRLDPQLESKPLIVIGTVSELPQRLEQSTRFLFAPESMTVDGQTVKKYPSLIRLNWSGLYAKSTAKNPADERDEIDEISMGKGSKIGVNPNLNKQGESSLRAGQRWRFEVRIKRPVGQVNTGQFDSELKALQNGIGATGTVRSGRLLNPFVFSIGHVVERTRDQLDRAISDVAGRIDPRTVGLIRALTVGNQQAISRDDWQLFNRTGVSHLMSISGLHITMLAALGARCGSVIWSMLAKYFPGRWLAYLPNKPSFTLMFALIIALIYSLVAGWEVPSQRTWYCLALFGLLLGRGRRVSFWVVLQVVALIIVVIDPWAVMSAGFSLSFGAVAAIVWANQNPFFLAQGARTRWAWLKEATRSQWACTVSLIPLLVLLFGSVSVIGPMANAVAIPVVSFIITPLALTAALLSVWFETRSLWIMQIIHWASLPLLTFLEFISHWQWASWSSAKPPWWLAGIGLIGTACVLAPFTRRARIPAMLVMLACLIARYQAPESGAWRLSILDVGQGAAAVIESGGQIAMIDTGASEGSENGVQADAAKRLLIPWLQTRAIDRIDHLILGSANANRVGGAASLVAHIRPQYIHAPLASDSVIAASLPAFTACQRGHRWQMGGLSFEFLHPPPDPQSESKVKSLIKASSCVLKIDGPHNRIILAGDIEAAQEQRLLQLFEPDQLKADVVLIPNQGSKQSSSEAFVKAIRARYGVVSSAYRNRLKLPSDQILKRYEAADTQVLRTDRDGGLTFNFKPDGQIVIDRARLQDPPYWRIPVIE